MTTSTEHQTQFDDAVVLDDTSGETGADLPNEPEAEVELSGVDLARVALHNAREAARRRGAEPAAKRKPRAALRSRDGGREPVGLAGALRGLLADHAWQTPVAGGGVLADWPRIAPDLAEHVQAVGYDPETATLELRPLSSAFGTYLRLNSTSIIGRVNAHTGDTTVRHLKVLGTGSGTPMPPRPDQPGPASPQATVPAPRESSAGYQLAKAACHAAQPLDTLAPEIRAAIERQTAAMAREPEDAFIPALEERLQLEARQRQAADRHTKALRRARHDRTAQQLPSIAPAPGTDATGLGQTA